MCNPIKKADGEIIEPSLDYSQKFKIMLLLSGAYVLLIKLYRNINCQKLQSVYSRPLE